jgi:hypothetical protein
MLTESQRFAALKMLLFFQKRFNGVTRLTAIWVDLVEGEKGAENTNCSIFGRPLHEALLAQPNTLQFALFSGLLARRYPVYSKINY